jgi:RND family efflux transporter MFP subunit
MTRESSLSLASVVVRSRAALIAVGAVSALVLGACTAESAADPRTEPPLVRTSLVDDAGAVSRAFTGVVAARIQSDLGFRVPGKLLERFVDTGETVTKGQRLARIDPADLNLAAHAQQEAVAAAHALAKQTAADEVRYRNLRERGAVSASAHEQAKAAADVAAAQLRAVEAQASVARNASRYATLFADADGVVMETLVEPGQVVGAGQVVIRVAHAGPREAIVQLPETLRPALGSLGQATLYGNGSHGVPAKLRQLSDVADPMTRTFEARYVLEDELAEAPLGTTVTIRIADARTAAPAAFQIPIAALLDAGKGPGVWVIAAQPNRVTWRPVTVVRVDDEHAYISGKFSEGERIVSLGAHLLREGQPVRLADEASAKIASVHP